MSDPQTVESTPLDDLLAAVANPLRRQLIDRLAHGPETAGELASGAGVSMPSMSRHLRILEQTGLIIRMKQGRNHVIELRPDALLPAGDWLNSVIPDAVTAPAEPSTLETPAPGAAVTAQRTRPAVGVASPPQAATPRPKPDPLTLDLTSVLQHRPAAETPADADSSDGPDLSPDSLSNLVEQLRGRRG